MRVAIQHDDYGPGDSSAARWKSLLELRGHLVTMVDAYRPEGMAALLRVDGFMWRFAHLPRMLVLARRLIPLLEEHLGLVVYPDLKTSWHYDDKVAQGLIFAALDIPYPRTWIWFRPDEAHSWVSAAEFPVVAKLATGAASRAVTLVRNRREGHELVDRMFTTGVSDIARVGRVDPRRVTQRLRSASAAWRGDENLPFWNVERGYVLFQEFIPDNPFDTRVTIIGDRAFMFRRHNRQGDFRASGSGRIDYSVSSEWSDAIALAFSVNQKLGMQSCAMDVLWKGDEPVLCEVSYTFVSSAVEACPGHWSSDRTWHEGPLSAEEAQIEDYARRLEGASHRLAESTRKCQDPW